MVLLRVVKAHIFFSRTRRTGSAGAGSGRAGSAERSRLSRSRLSRSRLSRNRSRSLQLRLRDRCLHLPVASFLQKRSNHMAKNKQVKHRDKKASKRSRIFAALSLYHGRGHGIFVWKWRFQSFLANSITQKLPPVSKLPLLFPNGAGAQEVARFFLRTSYFATKERVLKSGKASGC